FQKITFHGVADGVAEIQDRPQAIFQRVFLHDADFDGDGGSKNIKPRTFRKFLPKTRDGKLIAADKRVFDHFGETATQFPFGQRFQKIRVNEDGGGVSENADGVFNALKINTEFAADGGIGHGEQSGGNLDKIHASFPGSGAKATHVADHSAAEVDDKRFAVELGIE